MGAQATRLSDVKVKAAKPKEKDYILTDGDGLQMRVRANGSKLWNFNYIHPTTKKRINMGLGTFPEVSLAQARKRTVEARETTIALLKKWTTLKPAHVTKACVSAQA